MILQRGSVRMNAGAALFNGEQGIRES